jgi:cytochrome c oxidase subunit 2
MTRRSSRRLRFVVSALALAASATACSWVIGDTPQSTVHPGTEATRMIQSVYRTIGWWVLGIFVVVEGALLYVILRYRRKPGERGVPEQVHGSTPLEVGWTLVPLVIVIVFIFPTLRTTCTLAKAAPDSALQVKVSGKRWWFEFEYPEYGIITANELHVPVGRMANLALTSNNVIHSFWVPRLAGKRDLVPGRTQYVWFTPETPGWYEGQCAELCGASHALMQFRVKVDTPQEFAAWVEAQRKPAQVDLSHPGFQAFQSSACFTCHSIQGSPFTFARIGPDLTHVGARTTLAAASLGNTPANMKTWIRNAGDLKPGHASKERQEPDLMWNFEHLPEAQLDALVEFLYELK